MTDRIPGSIPGNIYGKVPGTTPGGTPGSTAAPPEPLLDLSRLVAGIRWRRHVWMSIAAVGLLGGMLLALLLPTPPTAITRLLIIHENDSESASTGLMATNVALLETTRIAAATLERLGVDEPPETFLRSYRAEALTGNVLELTVRAGTDQEAIARAQALAEVFIADHVARSEATANAAAQVLLDRRAQAESELAEVDQSIAAITAGTASASSADLDALYIRRADLIGQIDGFAERAEAARTGAPRVAAGTQIVDPPRVDNDSPVVAAIKYAMAGAVLGLGAGLALAAVAAVVSDRPVLRRDIAAHLGASVIAQLPDVPRGPGWLWPRADQEAQRGRVAATLVRAIREDPGAVSLLELGCPQTAAELALDVAGGLATHGPVVVVDDLPGRELSRLVESLPNPAVRVLDGAEYSPAGPGQAQSDHQLGVGSVAPGATWTDLRRLGPESLLVVRAGYADTPWLHTVARQLADSRIVVIGVVLVHPDPRDRSDGTLWDALHTALRGRVPRRVGKASTEERPIDQLPAVGSEPQRSAEVS